MKKRLTTFVAAVSLLALTGCTPFLPVDPTTPSSTETVAVTSISLDSTSTSLKVGETKLLNVTINPKNASNRKVTWSSSNSLVATVSSGGLVTAKAKGTATITVISQGDTTKKATCVVTVGDQPSTTVAVTSVSLNKTSHTLTVGETYTLTATVSPSNATDRSVTWSSSSSSVASVSTSGVVTAKAKGTATITATSNSDSSKKATCTVTVNESSVTPTTDKDAFTLLLYICGADLESGGPNNYGSYSSSNADRYGGEASADITEIINASGQPDNVNVLIETGGAKAWASKHGISASKLERYHVKNKTLVKDASITKANMGKTSTLQSFITWGIQTYPAEKYGLILWNHGGAMEGCCFDENYENSSDYYLTASEVASAVSGSLNATGMTGQKLEFIGYDCCLMQVQDIAELNSQYFNYMIASQETESGTGWDYDNWLPDLYAYKSTPVVLQKICDTFIYENEVDMLTGKHSDTASDQTASFLDLSKMPAYKEAFEAMAAKMSSCVSNYGKSNFKTLMKKVQSYGNCHYTKQEIDAYQQYYDMSDYKYDSDIGYYCDLSNGIQRFGTFDVKDFLDKISGINRFSSMSSEIAAVRTALSELVVYNNASYRAGNSNGLCLVYSYSNLVDYSYTSSQTNFNKWFSFNATYGY